jgi:hypothetical protein
MKNPSDHTKLDEFIVETLKRESPDIPRVEWSEIEVLLPHRQKSLSIGISKKTIVFFSSAIVITFIAFGVFKIARHYSSFPVETKNLTDSTKNIFSIMDTSVQQDSVFVIPDINYTDTGVFTQKQKIDSDSAVISADTAAMKKTNVQPITTASKIIQQQKPKQDKTQKLSVADTSSKKTHTEPMSDTVVSEPLSANAETKTEIRSADTTNKNIPTPQKKSKNKTSKSQKKDTTAGASKTALPVQETKPDTSQKQ